MPGDVIDLDACPHCGGEVRFGERQHHLDEACVPEVVVRPPGFAGRMPRLGDIFREAQAHDFREALRRAQEYTRKSSPR